MTPHAGARRHGATLIELLVALAISAIVLGAAVRLMLSAVRSSDRTRERARQQAMFRSVGRVLSREVAGIDPASDIGGIAPESLTVRALRGSGRTCGTDAGALVVATATFHGWRLPDMQRDSLRVPAATGDAWIAEPLLGSVSRSRCADGTPGLRLPVGGTLAARAAVASVAVRVTEWVRFRVYANADGWWLGQRSLRRGDVVQPIAGPFSSGALTFQALDGAGAPTVDVHALRSLAVAMRTRHDGTMRGVAADSVLAWVWSGGGP